MALSKGDIQIQAELTLEEAEVILGILDKEVGQKPLEARLRFEVGDICKAELEWWDRHSSWLESVVKKLFPDYRRHG